MINCEEVREMLDGYALGAAGKSEASAIEKHVADCVQCWEDLTKAQRTAALLALTSPIHEAPPALESRIMEAASREPVVERGKGTRTPLLGKIRLGWPAAASALGVAAAAALAFAAFLQIQMNDLRNDKDALAEQLGSTKDVVNDQARVIAISAASDEQNMVMEAVAAPAGASGEYHWSRSAGGGFIVCHDLPALAQGEVYQAWFDEGGKRVSAGTFSPSEDGGCVYPMQPEAPVRGPDGVGVSKEKAGGSASPSGDWLIYAAFEGN